MAAVLEKEPEEVRRITSTLETKAKEWKPQMAVDAMLAALGLFAPARIGMQEASRKVVREALRQIPERKAALQWARTQLKGITKTPREVLERVGDIEVKPLLRERGNIEEFINRVGQVVRRDVRLSPTTGVRTTWPHEMAHLMQMVEREAGKPTATRLLGGLPTWETAEVAGKYMHPASEAHAQTFARRVLDALGGLAPGKAFTQPEYTKMYREALREALEAGGIAY